MLAAYGKVDCLVNAAGLTTRGTLLDTTPELFDAHVAVNLRGPFFLMQAVVRSLVERGAPGSIVNVISSSELGGQPYLAPYVAAKAGLAGLTRNAAYAHRFDRIRINGVDIGWTDTEGEDATQREFHGADDSWRERAARALPMGRLGRVGRDRRVHRVPALRPQRRGHRVGAGLGPDRLRRARLTRLSAGRIDEAAGQSGGAGTLYGVTTWMVDGHGGGRCGSARCACMITWQARRMSWPRSWCSTADSRPACSRPRCPRRGRGR